MTEITIQLNQILRLIILEKHKFKQKGDLVAYAAKYPGAMIGYLLTAVYAKLTKGLPSSTEHRHGVNVSTWAAQHTGLTEVRDLREVATLAAAIDAVNRREVEKALDILSQRIMAIQKAKSKGGTWDKAEALELLPGSGTSMVPGGMLSLTL